MPDRRVDQAAMPSAPELARDRLPCRASSEKGPGEAVRLPRETRRKRIVKPGAIRCDKIIPYPRDTPACQVFGREVETNSRPVRSGPTGSWRVPEASGGGTRGSGASSTHQRIEDKMEASPSSRGVFRRARRGAGVIASLSNFNRFLGTFLKSLSASRFHERIEKPGGASLCRGLADQARREGQGAFSRVVPDVGSLNLVDPTPRRLRRWGSR
jgi:hypothetical protein